MRLLFDLQGLQTASSRSRGIGRYVRSLARAMLVNAGEHKIDFLLNDLHPESFTEIYSYFSDVASADQFHIVSVAGSMSARQSQLDWWQRTSKIIYQKYVEDFNPDVLLVGSMFEGGGGDATISLGCQNCIRAVILYDLIPLLDPGVHLRSKITRDWYFNKIDELCQADLLLGISHSACAEARENLSIPQGNIDYIGAASSDDFSDRYNKKAYQQDLVKHVLTLHGISKPFVMHASAFDDRKNFQGLIHAFSRLPRAVRDHHQLVLVCKINSAARDLLHQAIDQAGLSELDVILTGFVPDDELRILYSQCKIFAFPSFHEGFGLPVLEAMWCGAPVIGSNKSSLPEVIGREDAQFDPYDPIDIVRVLCRALSDEDWRQELINHAAFHAHRFSWDEVALRTFASIEGKLERRSFDVTYGQASMEVFIEKIAQQALQSRPNERDLLAVARALAANERTSVPFGDVQSMNLSGGGAL